MPDETKKTYGRLEYELEVALGECSGLRNIANQQCRRIAALSKEIDRLNGELDLNSRHAASMEEAAATAIKRAQGLQKKFDDLRNKVTTDGVSGDA